MKIIKVKDYDEMSTTACELMVDRIRTIKKPVLGLATGSTPIGLYEQLIETYKQDHVSFKNVTTFNLDEYIELVMDKLNSYHLYMINKLFTYIVFFTYITNSM